MRNVRDILRLHTEHQLAGRQIARSLGLAHGTVMGVLHRAAALGLTWPLPAELDDAALEGQLYPPTPGQTAGRAEPAGKRCIGSCAAKDDPAALMAGVPPRLSRRVPVQSVLRAIPADGQASSMWSSDSRTARAEI